MDTHSQKRMAARILGIGVSRVRVSADKEVRATVVVSWNDGVISNEVEVSSQLLNTSR